MNRSPESASFGMGDHLDLSANADLLERSYTSTPYNGNNASSSSKAVLAALRALQDKIRRLESERSQALDEATQLRHQLKNQEVEAEHAKQREQLTAQKSLHEVRAAYERLLTDKSELEVRLSKFEEKNKHAQIGVDELQAKIRILEDEKHAGNMKLKDLEHQRLQIENSIKMAQQKEEEMAQSMVWETKRHEETLSFNQKRIQTLQDELTEVCQEKGMADAKLMELDQLVGQLLSVNESLVAQLTGKPLKHHDGPRTKTKKAKKTAVPRAATLSTAASDASKVEKYSQRRHSQLIPVMTDDVAALKSMHTMYSNIAKSIKRSASPARSNSAAKSRSTTPGSVASGKGKIATRLSRKKAQLIEQFNDEARSSLEFAQHHVPASYSHSDLRPQSAPSGGRSGASATNFTPRGSMEVRLPKPSASYEAPDNLNVSGDLDDYYHRNAAYQNSFLNSSSHNAAVAPSPAAPHVSFTHGAMSPVVNTTSTSHYPCEADVAGHRAPHTGTSSHAPQPHNKADMQGVISALEDEFDQLNNEYRKLLSNVQTGSFATGQGNDFARSVPVTTPESIQAQAEEIVNVIQKLHKKGEQLRTLKSSP